MGCHRLRLCFRLWSCESVFVSNGLHVPLMYGYVFVCVIVRVRVVGGVAVFPDELNRPNLGLRVCVSGM